MGYLGGNLSLLGHDGHEDGGLNEVLCLDSTDSGSMGDIESYFGMFRWATVEKVHGATEDQGWLLFIFSLGLHFLFFKRRVA